MAQIACIPPNGLTVASTFAGAGGSSTGWAIAGYRVLWACEFHPPAADSYAANHPETVLDRRDVRVVTGEQIVTACGGVVPDILDGSPPCQDFSMAGKRTRGWGEARAHGDGTTQRSDDLFAQYLRLVGELRPRAFVAENVKGLITGAAKGHFKRIMAGLAGHGYRVRAKVLDAQWLGVPQRRKRVIIVGVRDDLDALPQFPEPLPWRYSMLDACPWFGGFDSVRGGHGFSDETKPLDGPAPTIGATPEGRGRWELRHNHVAGLHRHRGRVDIDQPAVTITVQDVNHLAMRRVAYQAGTNRYASGRSESLGEPIHAITTQGVRGMKRSEVTVVYDPCTYHAGHVDQASEPASTINAGGMRGVNIRQALVDDGVEQRQLTIAEVKRLCSFPDDYVLTGSHADQWSRLGNSVPPLMMAAIGRALIPVLSVDGGLGQDLDADDAPPGEGGRD